MKIKDIFFGMKKTQLIKIKKTIYIFITYLKKRSLN